MDYRWPFILFCFFIGIFIPGEMLYPQDTVDRKSEWSKIFDHPTSKILNHSMDSSDYLNNQKFFLDHLTRKRDEPVYTFGYQLHPKEVASLFHQKDLLNALLKNQMLFSELKELGFDVSAYIRGSIDSDMGKLKAYQELFTMPSAKSDFLFKFLQGRVAQKSWVVVREIFKQYEMPDRPFLNPNIEIQKLRNIFRSHPILLGYFHEFPGMIDAVLAYELNKLSKNEFKNQILVNLGHSGPSAGYWNYLEKVLIPKALGDQEEILKDVFQGTQYQLEKHGDGHPHYFSPTSFESFVSTFFDRLSQCTRGGYLKIDYEISGNPIKAVWTLLLNDNNLGTIKQLQLLKNQMQSSSHFSKEKKNFFINLSNSGILYLERYLEFLKKKVHYRKSTGEESVTVMVNNKEKKFIYKNQKYYLFEIKKENIISKEQMRKALHKAIHPVLLRAEEKVGDPFQDSKWQ